jgi:hypothetical protein
VIEAYRHGQPGDFGKRRGRFGRRRQNCVGRQDEHVLEGGTLDLFGLIQALDVTIIVGTLLVFTTRSGAFAPASR